MEEERNEPPVKGELRIVNVKKDGNSTLELEYWDGEQWVPMSEVIEEDD